MAIRNKSKEELQAQAEWFLDYANKKWEITEKQKEKILKTLWISKIDKERFIDWLSKKFSKEIDITNEAEIKKKLQGKKIDVENLWNEYLEYLALNKHESAIREKVKSFFEPYKTDSSETNEIIMNLISDNYSKTVIEKAKIFLLNNCTEVFTKKDLFEYYILWNINCDNLKFLLNNFQLEELEIIAKSPIQIIKYDDSTWEEKANEYYDITEWDIEIIKNNVLLLKRYGFNYKDINLNNLKDVNIEHYVEIINSCDIEWFWNDFDEKDENEELKKIFFEFKSSTKEEILERCIDYWSYKIDEVLSKMPKINYENNSRYTKKFVHMFWNDWSNNEKMADFFAWESYYEQFNWHHNILNYSFLAYLRTVYWTKNWKKNIDLVYKNWFIKDKKISSDENKYCSNNYTLTQLKIIDNNILDSLLKKWVHKKDFDKFLLMLYSINNKNLTFMLEKYPNITIKELNLLKAVLCYWKLENLDVIFKKYPKISIKEIIILENEKTCIVSSAKTENLNIIFKGYPNITIEELILFNDILHSFEAENLNIILKKYQWITIKELISIIDILNTNSTSIFEEINNFWNEIPSIKSLHIFNLINDNTTRHREIFEDIRDTDRIKESNWIDVTWLYSAIEYFEDDRIIPEEIKVKIRELLSNDESKDLIYRKLTELLNKSLLDANRLTNEEIALLAVLNKKWLFNMRQSDSLSKFIYQINKLDKNYKFWKAFEEIKWSINYFIDCHKNDSNEFMNSFYQISTSLLEKSPSVYRILLELLNNLNQKEQEIFYKDIFPLYNVELFLWESQWKILWKKINNNVEWQLIPMHERIKTLLNKIKEWEKNNNINSLLNEEKGNLIINIKQLFKEKFWIKKIPSDFTNENIESIKWHSIYLSNMNNRDEEKTAVLWYFLALKLDWKRKEYREWKYFDPNEYMDDSKVLILTEYLSKKSERDSIYKLENIQENDKQILQENESNTIIWNANWITDRLNTIEHNIKTLLDDDIYSERQKIIKKYLGKNLWKLLAKQFQILSGKNITLTDEEKQTLDNISYELWDNLADVKNVQNLQNECKPISAIVNFVNKIINENLSKEINDFEKVCVPSNEHLELLRKIWINLEDNLIISSNSYLTYLESNIRKWKTKLTDDEYNSLDGYIGKVKTELDDLYWIKDRLTTLYETLKKDIIDKYFSNTLVENRFEEMKPFFFTKADVEKENIVSLMTNDLDIVIKNIRQCLWCKDKWCNNDTDLSFGCDDRFFITTSHREWDTSFADELVTLLPRSPKEEWFTFVMDRIYWNNWSTDVLLNNIYVILKKINKLSPELRKKISIFVPDGIGLTLNENWIVKIKKQHEWISINKQKITVSVEKQPITDSYHEFGGIGARGTWDAEILGYLIKIE